MRDAGRIDCYRAEWSLGDQPQVGWSELCDLALRVVRDPLVGQAFPALERRRLVLRPRHEHRSDWIGQWDPRANRISLAWGGRSGLVLMHELAHAATPGDKHQRRWREAYVYLTWRFLGDDLGRRLAAAFVNHDALDNHRRATCGS